MSYVLSFPYFPPGSAFRILLGGKSLGKIHHGQFSMLVGEKNPRPQHSRQMCGWLGNGRLYVVGDNVDNKKGEGLVQLFLDRVTRFELRV